MDENIMSKLTARQNQILKLIQRFIDAQGFPPTRAEIAAKFGFRSPNAAEDHLRALERKGMIALLPGASRGIRLLVDRPAGLPVIGRVRAGYPVLADEHIEGYQRLDPEQFQPAADYLLRMRGTSMREAGILNGDLLAVHASSEAVSGQIVVARLDDELTVKRYRRRGYQVRLLAESPDFAPIELDLRKDPVVIEGIAVGVLRTHLPIQTRLTGRS